MALVEVEYLKGGKRRKMREVFAKVLTAQGIVKRVEPNDPATAPAQPRILVSEPERVPQALTAKDEVAEEGEEATAKKKRVYKRRDMTAEK